MIQHQGVTNGKSYCEAQTVIISDDNLDTVTVNGNEVSLDEGEYLLTADGTKYTIVASDRAGNSTTMAVTVNNGHDFSGALGKDADGHWKKCSHCDATGTKEKHVYDNDEDTVCNICGYTRAIDEPEEDEPDGSNDDNNQQPADSGSSDDRHGQPTGQDKTDNLNNGNGQPMNTDSSDNKYDQSAQQEGDEDRKQQEKDDVERQEGGENKKQPENHDKQPGLIENDGETLVITGEKVTTGNIPEAESSETTLDVGEGKVVVTVICEDEDYTAGVADTVAVANAVLTPEQIQRTYSGENVEIRVDVQDISGHVPASEQEAVEECIGQQNEIPDLQVGMYIDISMYTRVGDGDWNPVTQTREPIDVVIGIPEELRGEGRNYYIIRSHEGGITLLYDMDHEDDTITIRTEQFSTYAIAYTQMDVKTKKCGLCHICPTFLGICCFIWLAVIVLTAVVIIRMMHRKNRQGKTK